MKTHSVTCLDDLLLVKEFRSTVPRSILQGLILFLVFLIWWTPSKNKTTPLFPQTGYQPLLRRSFFHRRSDRFFKNGYREK